MPQKWKSMDGLGIELGTPASLVRCSTTELSRPISTQAITKEGGKGHWVLPQEKRGSSRTRPRFSVGSSTTARMGTSTRSFYHGTAPNCTLCSRLKKENTKLKWLLHHCISSWWIFKHSNYQFREIFKLNCRNSKHLFFFAKYSKNMNWENKCKLITGREVILPVASFLALVPFGRFLSESQFA